MLARLRENLAYKMLALGFAIALHFYVTGQENPAQSRPVQVPLTVRGLPSDLIFDEKSVPPISVTLSGPAELLGRLPDADVTASVDLSAAHAGKNAPKPVHVNLPPGEAGLSVDVQPSAVAVTLSAKGKKSAPITASDPGTPPAGFMFRPARITPGMATIVGTQEAVDSVQQVVANVDTGGSVGTIDGDFPVVALDGQGSQVGGVTVTPAVARVRIMMSKVPAAKTLIISANLTGTLPYPYRITGIDISPQSVTVTGRPELLAQVFTVQTAPIDLSGATGDVTRQVVCPPPPGLMISGPDRVTVTVHVAAPPAPPGATGSVTPVPPATASPDAPKPP